MILLGPIFSASGSDIYVVDIILNEKFYTIENYDKFITVLCILNGLVLLPQDYTIDSSGVLRLNIDYVQGDILFIKIFYRR